MMEKQTPSFLSQFPPPSNFIVSNLQLQINACRDIELIISKYFSEKRLTMSFRYFVFKDKLSSNSVFYSISSPLENRAKIVSIFDSNDITLYSPDNNHVRQLMDVILDIPEQGNPFVINDSSEHNRRWARGLGSYVFQSTPLIEETTDQTLTLNFSQEQLNYGPIIPLDKVQINRELIGDFLELASKGRSY